MDEFYRPKPIWPSPSSLNTEYMFQSQFNSASRVLSFFYPSAEPDQTGSSPEFAGASPEFVTGVLNQSSSPIDL
ncbi:unnamed protein product [Cuscuta campestris]|uniref:Uncharacterized protein n=1 Tax=Cuscuta campestris TaxID=132261 RepID=A0A484KNX0_9ASTE|nr:unnamed protein product [Cuscuta campestris]